MASLKGSSRILKQEMIEQRDVVGRNNTKEEDKVGENNLKDEIKEESLIDIVQEEGIKV